MRSARSSWRCASTPSLIRPGSTPSSCEESWRISSIVMMSFSPALLMTVQTPSVVVALLEGAGRGHPVEGLVGAVVRVDRDAAVRLDQDQPGGRGQMGGEPARVVDGAAGDDETHGRQRYSTGPGPRDSPRESRSPDRGCSVWPICCDRIVMAGYVRILLVPSPAVAYRVKREVATRVRSVFGRVLPCPSAPAVRGCERRTHVARRLTGPTRTGRARRGRRSRLRRLRPDLPALRVGDDQLPGGPAEGRRR